MLPWPATGRAFGFVGWGSQASVPPEGVCEKRVTGIVLRIGWLANPVFDQWRLRLTLLPCEPNSGVIRLTVSSFVAIHR
tara:strand:- start:267 stop:503 length:237 start_codon:yes stop_codon:yes gene_type:complete